MKRMAINRRTLALIAVMVPLLALFAYTALRSGPLAPIPVTTIVVTEASVTPALFGIGTVEARYTYRIGPTLAGRVKAVAVHVGDRVQAGQQLGEMDPVDLEERIEAQTATLGRSEAEVRAARATLADTTARRAFADAQAHRYGRLFAENVVSAEVVQARQQEQQTAAAGNLNAQARLEAAQREMARIAAEREGLIQQRDNLRLMSPVDGLVTVRNAEPGSTVVAGQAVVEMIDPASAWINVRFDQVGATGLEAGLPAQIVLRSRDGAGLAGRVLRVEPLADAVTEELLAKVVFDPRPPALPPIGELAEVTVTLQALPSA
ncbi:MAG: efflux RND transporter periplasmic adaptor subunit, partial [Desulfatitalea sp.]|nr:efflux RND transporter periplasmic adaptor subunit [Desulfatitalea sp.]